MPSPTVPRSSSDPRLVHHFQVASRIAAAGAALIGIVVLAGWTFGIESLKSIIPGQVTMKPNAAVAFVLCGVAIWCLGTISTGRIRRTFGQACTFAVTLIGVLTLVEYVFRINLGIDVLLFYEAPGTIGTLSPGRMAALAALNFALIGGALLLWNAGQHRGVLPCEALTLGVMAGSFVPGLEYLLGIVNFTALAELTRMAVPTTFGFLFVCAGVLFARADRGLMRVTTAKTQGGSAWRRLLPAAIVTPPLFGWLRIVGERAGYYESAVGTLLMVAVLTVILGFLVWSYANSLDATDRERNETEDQLRGASGYARSLLEASLDPLVTISGEGKITDVNEATELVTGVSRERLIGSDFCDYFTEPEKARQGYRQVFEQGEVRDYPLAIRHTSGRITHVLYNATVYKNEEGEVQGVFAAARDITERKQAEQKLREQAALLDLAYDAILVRDSDSRVLFWNRGATRTYGFSADEAIGKISHELLSTVFPSPLKEIEFRVLQAGEWEGEFRHTRKDGEQIVVASRWSMVRDEQGNPIGAMEINRDITERKRAEEALRRIEWMLSEKTPASVEGGAGLPAASAPSSPYGDLTELNTSRVILDSVGKPLLHEIASNFMDLLGSSAAIYEKNSDYALGLFTSGWCRTLDCASRGLCGTADNMEALSCGKWLCHESCWSKATAAAIQSGEPVDVECAGGMHIYAMPIRAGAEVIGGINFGFGDPPRDESTLRELAEKYGVNVEELRRHAEAYETRPTFIIEMAKKRLSAAADLIGEIVQRRQAEEQLAQKAKDLARSNEELAQFAYVASHDLQEPLRKIGAFGDRLAAHSGGALDEQGRDYLERMQNASRRMWRN